MPNPAWLSLPQRFASEQTQPTCFTRNTRASNTPHATTHPTHTYLTLRPPIPPPPHPALTPQPPLPSQTVSNLTRSPYPLLPETNPRATSIAISMADTEKGDTGIGAIEAEFSTSAFEALERDFQEVSPNSPRNYLPFIPPIIPPRLPTNLF